MFSWYFLSLRPVWCTRFVACYMGLCGISYNAQKGKLFKISCFGCKETNARGKSPFVEEPNMSETQNVMHAKHANHDTSSRRRRQEMRWTRILSHCHIAATTARFEPARLSYFSTPYASTLNSRKQLINTPEKRCRASHTWREKQTKYERVKTEIKKRLLILSFLFILSLFSAFHPRSLRNKGKKALSIHLEVSVVDHVDV